MDLTLRHPLTANMPDDRSVLRKLRPKESVRSLLGGNRASIAVPVSRMHLWSLTRASPAERGDREECAILIFDSTRLSCDHEPGCRPDVAGATANTDLDRPGFHDEIARKACVGQQARQHHERNGFRDAALKVHSGETDQLLPGERHPV